jgi:hypothetical protein
LTAGSRRGGRRHADGPGRADSGWWNLLRDDIDPRLRMSRDQSYPQRHDRGQCDEMTSNVLHDYTPLGALFWYDDGLAAVDGAAVSCRQVCGV